MMPDVKIVEGKRVFLDGLELVRKKIPWANHCREIFYTDEYVIKVIFDEEDHSSMDQNILEYRKWKKISKIKKDSIYFAPVVFCEKGGKYLIQKRFRFTTHRRTDDIRNKVNSLCKKYDIGDVPSHENRNWAMINRNHPLIYDYGLDEYWSE